MLPQQEPRDALSTVPLHAASRVVHLMRHEVLCDDAFKVHIQQWCTVSHCGIESYVVEWCDVQCLAGQWCIMQLSMVCSGVLYSTVSCYAVVYCEVKCAPWFTVQ